MDIYNYSNNKNMSVSTNQIQPFTRTTFEIKRLSAKVCENEITMNGYI